MAHARYPFWTHDTVAAAVLAGVGMASLQSKLDGVASELNVPVVTALVHGWPMVALFASLVLLVMRSVGEAEGSARGMENKKRDEIDLAGIATSELDRAVGEGLEPVQNEERDGGWNGASGGANPPSASGRPEDLVFAAALVGRVAICGGENQTGYASHW